VRDQPTVTHGGAIAIDYQHAPGRAIVGDEFARATPPVGEAVEPATAASRRLVALPAARAPPAAAERLALAAAGLSLALDALPARPQPSPRTIANGPCIGPRADGRA
jgi:hypothetical protein